MWVPVVAALVAGVNRCACGPWRSIDVSAVVLAVAGDFGAVIHSASVTSGSRLGSIRAVCRDRRAHCPLRTNADPGARHVSLDYGPHYSAASCSIRSALPGIWFPFGIGVSRTQYVYAIASRSGFFDRTNFALKKDRIDALTTLTNSVTARTLTKGHGRCGHPPRYFVAAMIARNVSRCEFASRALFPCKTR